MCALRRGRASPHQFSHKIRADCARVVCDLFRNIQCPWHYVVGLVCELSKKTLCETMICPVSCTSCHEVYGSSISQQFRQEERTAGFHDKPATRKDETNLGFSPGYTDSHREGHSYPNSNRMALYRSDGGLSALVNRDCNTSTAAEESAPSHTRVLMILHTRLYAPAQSRGPRCGTRLPGLRQRRTFDRAQ